MDFSAYGPTDDIHWGSWVASFYIFVARRDSMSAVQVVLLAV